MSWKLAIDRLEPVLYHAIDTLRINWDQHPDVRRMYNRIMISYSDYELFKAVGGYTIGAYIRKQLIPDSEEGEYVLDDIFIRLSDENIPYLTVAMQDKDY